MAASVMVPLIGPLLGLLAPLPYIYYSSKLGIRNGALVAAVALGAVGLFAAIAGYPRLPLVAVEFGLVGMGLSFIFRMRMSAGLTVLAGTVLMVAVGLAFLLVLAGAKGMGFVEMVEQYMLNHLEATLKIYGAGGQVKGAAGLTDVHRAVIEGIMKVFPALAVIGASFSVWLNVVVSRYVLRRAGLPAPDLGPLEQWRAPDNLVWLLIVSGFSLFLFSGGLKYLAINVFMVVSVVYLYQGVSIVSFFLKKYNVPGWLRPLVYFFLFVQQVITVAVALGGLFDQWLDFRRIHKRQIQN